MGVINRTAPVDERGPSIKKHVALVHIGGELGLLERKLVNVLLLGAYDELLTRREHQISQEMLCQLIGFDSKNTEHLKSALRTLASTPLEFNLVDGPKLKHRWGTGALLSWAELAGGTCSYSFIEQMAERLFDPDVYSSISIATQRSFRSSFALALYENCLRFRKVGSTGFWDIEKLRRLLGATAPLYDAFWRLKQRVIEPAMREIGEHSEILVTAEYRRATTRGSPVTAVKFLVADNPQSTMFPLVEDPHAPARESEGYKRLRALGVSDRLALATATSDPAFAVQVAAHVERKDRDGSIKKSRGAYASKLIHVGADLSEGQPRKPAPDTYAPSDNQAVKMANRYAEIRAFESHRNEQAEQRVTPQQRRQLLEKYVSEMAAKGTTIRGYDPDKGTISGVAAHAFTAYLTRAILGDYTQDDFEAWRQARPRP